MRVLQVHNEYRQAGGEDSVVATERRLLEDGGHEVESHIESNPEGPLSSIAGLAFAPWNPRSVARVLDTARDFKPDVAHVHNTWFRLSPAVVRRLHASGVPTVVTMHNYRLACLNAQFYRQGAPCEDCLGRVPWRGVSRGCYRDSPIQSSAVAGTLMVHRWLDTWGDGVDVVVALSEFAAARLAASGVPRERIVVKANVVEDPGPRHSPPSKSSYVVFAGRLTEEKGILDLVHAWASSPPPGLELRIAGSGPLEAATSEIAAAGVTMLGQVSPPQLRELLLGARALIFPSRWYEGQAMILLEALSAGTPVVFSRLGAIPEAVGDAGWSFEPGGSPSLVEALGRIMDDPEVDDRGRAARKRFEEHFAPDVGLRNLEALYSRARETRERGHA